MLLSANLTLFFTFSLRFTNHSLWLVMWLEHPVSRYQRSESSSSKLVVAISSTSELSSSIFPLLFCLATLIYDEQRLIIFLVWIMISCPLHLTRIFPSSCTNFVSSWKWKSLSFGHTTYHYSCHWEWVEKLGDFHWKMPSLLVDARNSKKCAQLWIHICRYTDILIFFILTLLKWWHIH